VEDINYEEDVKIDEMALDIEWLRQPELMRKYAQYAAEAKKAMDEAKERLDVGIAKLDSEIRVNPNAYGLSKVTESAIQNTILLQPEYQKLNKAYIEARYEYDIATAVVKAIDQRKTALENLVKLLGVSYFAGPQTPRDLHEETRRWLKERERFESNSKVRIRRRGKD